MAQVSCNDCRDSIYFSIRTLSLLADSYHISYPVSQFSDTLSLVLLPYLYDIDSADMGGHYCTLVAESYSFYDSLTWVSYQHHFSPDVFARRISNLADTVQNCPFVHLLLVDLFASYFFMVSASVLPSRRVSGVAYHTMTKVLSSFAHAVVDDIFKAPFYDLDYLTKEVK